MIIMPTMLRAKLELHIYETCQQENSNNDYRRAIYNNEFEIGEDDDVHAASHSVAKTVKSLNYY